MKLTMVCQVQDYMHNLVEQPAAKPAIRNFTDEAIHGYPEAHQDDIRLGIARQLPKVKLARDTAVAELSADQRAVLRAESTRYIKSKSDSKRKEEKKELLDEAWGGRRAWYPAEYFQNDSPGVNIISAYYTLTNTARQHDIPLQSLYEPGGFLHTLAHTQDPPSLPYRTLAPAIKEFVNSMPASAAAAAKKPENHQAGQHQGHQEQPEHLEQEEQNENIQQARDQGGDRDPAGGDLGSLSMNDSMAENSTAVRDEVEHEDSGRHTPETSRHAPFSNLLLTDDSLLAFNTDGDSQDRYDDLGDENLSPSCPVSDGLMFADTPGAQLESSPVISKEVSSTNPQSEASRSVDGPVSPPAIRLVGNPEAYNTAEKQLLSTDECLRGDTIYTAMRAVGPDKGTLTRRKTRVLDPLAIQVGQIVPHKCIPKIADLSHVYIPLHHIGNPGHWTLVHVRLLAPVDGPVAEDSPQQKDDYNCGIFVIMNYENLILRNCILQDINPLAERKRLLKSESRHVHFEILERISEEPESVLEDHGVLGSPPEPELKRERDKEETEVNTPKEEIMLPPAKRQRLQELLERLADIQHQTLEPGQVELVALKLKRAKQRLQEVQADVVVKREQLEKAVIKLTLWKTLGEARLKLVECGWDGKSAADTKNRLNASQRSHQQVEQEIADREQEIATVSAMVDRMKEFRRQQDKLQKLREGLDFLDKENHILSIEELGEFEQL
ncbi:hypothetical protein EsH8_XIV_000011 [Colletotrichum jinshuiense]